MNTPSHILINLAARKIKVLKSAIIPWQAVFWGSMMPDIPLGVLSLGTTFYYRAILGNLSQDLMETVLHSLYFNNPFWISAHNFLHAPFILGYPWQSCGDGGFVLEKYSTGCSGSSQAALFMLVSLF